jgi:hypothetical protein
VSRAERGLLAALRGLGPKPVDFESQENKKRYSERLSGAVAQAFAEELRERGLKGTRPAPPGEIGRSGAERRMAGGIGDKKVDVTFATEEAGLLLAISIKSINFIDKKTKNYQKNLTNRRGDMLFEAVTLHRRFPYAILAGVFFFDQGAASDGTSARKSTFQNAHNAFRIFTNRNDPAGRDEQFERLYIVLHDPSANPPTAQFFPAGEPGRPVTLDQVFDDLIERSAERNPDMYEAMNGQLRRVRTR